MHTGPHAPKNTRKHTHSHLENVWAQVSRQVVIGHRLDKCQRGVVLVDLDVRVISQCQELYLGSDGIARARQECHGGQ
jgi:hypothetical protein